ncbi:MAG: phage major capsid protein [Blastomonas sp.]
MKKFYTLVGALLAVTVSMLAGAAPAFATDAAMAAGISSLAFAGSLGAAGGGRMLMSAAERSMGRFMRGPEHDASSGNKTAAQLAAETKAAFDKRHDDVKAIAEKALAEAEAGKTLTATAKELADQAITAMTEAKARLDDVEQKLARHGGQPEADQTAGERFLADDRFKAFAAETRPRGRVLVEVKDISSLTTDAAGSVGTMIQPQRAAPVMQAQRRMTIRSLLMPGQISSNQLEYDKEVGFTNNADVVAEGASKPQSELQFEEATMNVRTIAHWMRASVQVLADAPALRSIIDQRLRYGLAFKEEVQLLNGDGTGQNLSGLITEATAYAAHASLVAESLIDDIRFGILQVALAEYPANGIVLNPIDWAYIETMKDSEGRYLIGNPQGTLTPILWGLPVVPTQAMTVDKFLVGAFDMAAQLFDRQDATVEVSTEDADNFTKNKVTIRAEERVGLAIYRPEALVYGDLGRVG